MNKLKYSAEYLIDIANSTGAVDSDKRYFCDNITFNAKDGWKVVIFYDQYDIDYIEFFISPDGEVINFWKWDDCPEKEMLMNWNG